MEIKQAHKATKNILNFGIDQILTNNDDTRRGKKNNARAIILALGKHGTIYILLIRENLSTEGPVPDYNPWRSMSKLLKKLTFFIWREGILFKEDFAHTEQALWPTA